MPLLTTEKNSYQYWEFKSPNGKKVKCMVVEGEGSITLKKNETWIGKTYILSKGLEHPDTVYLNTGSTEDDRETFITITAQAGDTLRSIARQYGVREQDITSGDNPIEEITEGQELTIPPSHWELYIETPKAATKAFELNVDLTDEDEFVDEDGQTNA